MMAASFQVPQATTKNPSDAQSISYINKQYGFRFDLPASWKGYSILTNERSEGWSGSAPPPNLEKYMVISIRHPLWTKEDPRQDIPIMVFTRRQWALVEQEKLIVSAAPFPPSELGKNSENVFALPARYNYGLLTGFEEVEKIMQGKPLHPF